MSAEKEKSALGGIAHEVATLAGAMGARGAALDDCDLAARAVCFAVPMQPWRPGFDHLSFWPGKLEEFKPGECGDNLRIAAAYLLLAIERQESQRQTRAA